MGFHENYNVKRLGLNLFILSGVTRGRNPSFVELRCVVWLVVAAF
jgi:hypothetical protein